MKAKKTRRELLVLGLALTAAVLSFLMPLSGFRLIAATISPSDEELLAENEALRQELAQRRQELTDYLDCHLTIRFCRRNSSGTCRWRTTAVSF